MDPTQCSSLDPVNFPTHLNRLASAHASATFDLNDWKKHFQHSILQNEKYFQRILWRSQLSEIKGNQVCRQKLDTFKHWLKTSQKSKTELPTTCVSITKLGQMWHNVVLWRYCIDASALHKNSFVLHTDVAIKRCSIHVVLIRQNLIFTITRWD